MRNLIIITIIWFVISLIMFDWGYTAGGYNGQSDQWHCIQAFKDCGQLHQFVPFPDNLFNTLSHLNVFDL